LNRRKFAVALLPVIFLVPSIAKTQTESIRRLDGSKISVQDADSFAKKTLADAHVTGAQIAVLNHGRLVWSAAFGLRRRDPALPMDQETTTWAASITKSVFATYVMQLVESKEFNLDRPIAAQLEKPLNEYEAYKDSASEIVHDPAWPTVTPRMLLSHSSGLLNFAAMEPDKKMACISSPALSSRIPAKASTWCSLSLSRRNTSRWTR
jgi:CubicO group peptidase (beta-lactamase class C family)